MKNTSAKRKDSEAALAALENLQQQEAEATCVTIPLPELLRGPKHVAELIMEEQSEHYAREGKFRLRREDYLRPGRKISVNSEKWGEGFRGQGEVDSEGCILTAVRYMWQPSRKRCHM